MKHVLEVYKLSTAAYILNVSISTLRRWYKQKKIELIQGDMTNHYYVSKSELERLATEIQQKLIQENIRLKQTVLELLKQQGELRKELLKWEN
jgi:transposase